MLAKDETPIPILLCCEENMLRVQLSIILSPGQIRLLLQTFPVARSSSFIFSQCSDFLSHSLQLLLDFLAVWSSVEAVVVIIHITMRFLRRFYRRVGECRDEASEQDSSKGIFHLINVYYSLVSVVLAFERTVLHVQWTKS